jgi:hypothetical protein
LLVYLCILKNFLMILYVHKDFFYNNINILNVFSKFSILLFCLLKIILLHLIFKVYFSDFVLEWLNFFKQKIFFVELFLKINAVLSKFTYDWIVHFINLNWVLFLFNFASNLKFTIFLLIFFVNVEVWIYLWNYVNHLITNSFILHIYYNTFYFLC